MSKLYEMLKGIDDRPFNGKRDIAPTPVVLRNHPADKFHNMSLLGNDRDAFYKMLEEGGLTLGKEYIAIAVEGHGDVFDVFVTTDKGNVESFMEICFEEPTNER